MAVSMDIKVLDVNQCPGKYYTPNAFKRTHKCDDKTSYVSIAADNFCPYTPGISLVCSYPGEGLLYRGVQV